VDGEYCSSLGAMDSPLDQARAHAGRDGLEGKRGLGRGVAGEVAMMSYRRQFRVVHQAGQLTFSWLVVDIMES
jgi:hypothetical protein